jgi:hypothetical protein
MKTMHVQLLETINRRVLNPILAFSTFALIMHFCLFLGMTMLITVMLPVTIAVPEQGQW